MISSRLDGRVSKAIASEVDHLGIIPSPVKLKAQKLVFTVVLTLSTKGTVLLMMVMTIFKT